MSDLYVTIPIPELERLHTELEHAASTLADYEQILAQGRAENERLRADLKVVASETALGLIEQRDREVERLHGSSFTLTQKLEFAQDEVERLKAVVKEALAQNERFDKRYRDAEADTERLRAELRTCQETLTAC
jgi:chromosome segregation ATPase